MKSQKVILEWMRGTPGAEVLDSNDDMDECKKYSWTTLIVYQRLSVSSFSVLWIFFDLYLPRIYIRFTRLR
jgi:hypothetical protein